MTSTALLLVAAIAVLCWAATCLRVVPAGTWLAVTRGGAVRRMRRRGLAWRLPLVERFEEEAVPVQDVPLHVRATTRDGVPVHVLVEARVALPVPAIGAPYADPWPAAERAAEEAIARSVTGWDTAELARTAAASERPLRGEVETILREHGVRVEGLRLIEVDVPIHGFR